MHVSGTHGEPWQGKHGNGMVMTQNDPHVPSGHYSAALAPVAMALSAYG